MPTLTYDDFGPDAHVLVGRELGVDATGHPWQCTAVDRESVPGKTLVTVEPWPLPLPGQVDEAFRDARLRLSRAERPSIP